MPLRAVSLLLFFLITIIVTSSKICIYVHSFQADYSQFFTKGGRRREERRGRRLRIRESLRAQMARHFTEPATNTGKHEPQSSSLSEVLPSNSTTSSSSSGSSSSQPTKTIYMIRHGTSLANEFMQQEGNEWGAPTFTDDMSLRDAPLSLRGHEECRLLAQSLAQDASWMEEVGLVLISPLTRCLQTFAEGVLPAVKPVLSASIVPHKDRTMPPIFVLPLIAERVYTASDIGTPVKSLQREWNHVDLDWSYVPDAAANVVDGDDDTDEDVGWWYSPNHQESDPSNEEPEWRPHGQGQTYAVPGEPLNVFQSRMRRLETWLHQRTEQSIMMVTHWAVIRHFTNEEVKNGQILRALLPLINSNSN